MKQISMKKIAISLLVAGYYLAGFSNLLAQHNSSSTSKPEIIFLCDSTRESFSLTIVDNKYYFHMQEQKVAMILNPEKIKTVSIEKKASDICKKNPLIMKYNEKVTDPIMIIKMKSD